MRYLVALIAVLALPAPAEARTCALPPHALQNASSAKAIVYKVGPRSRQYWWACWKPTGRRTRLPIAYNDIDGAYIAGVRLQGRYVAVARHNYDHYDNTSDDIFVYDMIAGKRHYKLRWLGHSDYGCWVVSLDGFTVTEHG